MNQQQLEQQLDDAIEQGDANLIDEISAKIDALENGGSGGQNDTVTPTVTTEGVPDNSATDEPVLDDAQQSVSNSIDVSHIKPPAQSQVSEEEYQALSESEQQKLLEVERALELSQQKISLYEEQLKANSITPEQLPHEMKLTQDDLAALKEDLEELGSVGSVTYKLANMLNAMQAKLEQQQIATSPQQSDEVKPDLFTLVPGLKEVMDNPTTRQKAIELDAALMQSPDWANVPEVERFKAVVAEINRAPLQNKKSPANDEEIVPHSIASAQQGQPLPAEDKLAQYENLSEEELASAMEGMSEAELDEVFKSL